MTPPDNSDEKKNNDKKIIELESFKRAKKEEERKKHQDSRPIKPTSQPIINIPPLTKYISAFLVLTYALQYYGPINVDYWIMTHLSFVPASLSTDNVTDIWAPLSLVTHMFLHGGWLHVAMNVLMLVAFGAGLERAISKGDYLNIFFLSGIVGAFAQFMLDPTSTIPMVGASGAVSGFFGAILIIMQRSGQLGRGARLLPFILLWVGISVLFGYMGSPVGGESYDNIAWAAHLGGFFAGLGFAKYRL